MGYDESRIRIERKSGFRNWERNLNGEREREKSSNLNLSERGRGSVRWVSLEGKKRTKWKQNPFSFFYLYIYLFITFSDRNLHPWDDRIQHTNNSDRCGPPQSPSFQMNGSLLYHPFLSIILSKNYIIQHYKVFIFIPNTSLMFKTKNTPFFSKKKYFIK